MVEVNHGLIQQLAQLAKLDLTEDEIKALIPQLSKILKYIDQLQEVNVEGTEPLTYPIELQLHSRPDVVQPFPLDAQGKSKVLQSAPDVLYDGFKVPSIL